MLIDTDSFFSARPRTAVAWSETLVLTRPSPDQRVLVLTLLSSM